MVDQVNEWLKLIRPDNKEATVLFEETVLELSRRLSNSGETDAESTRHSVAGSNKERTLDRRGGGQQSLGQLPSAVLVKPFLVWRKTLVIVNTKRNYVYIVVRQRKPEALCLQILR